MLRISLKISFCLGKQKSLGETFSLLSNYLQCPLYAYVFVSIPEYASVGYMAKRIQMRKNRFLALQKMAEQKKNEAMNASNAAMTDGGPPDHHGMPKQTVSSPLHLVIFRILSD